MITYVNKSNADKYSYLYSQASEDLRTHDANGNPVPYGDSNAMKGFEELTGKDALTPDEYTPGRYYVKDEAGNYVICHDTDFDPSKTYYLSDDITSLDEYFSYIVELNAINKRYTILPLDKEVFEIDANSRTITVPAVFAKNGISVQGDEVSEIVYFRINKFYDAIDLSIRDIYIEWKSAAKDENGKEIAGVSVPYVIDVESDPGYIIFGWPLSSKITQAAGQVSFAVRFYTFDKETDTLKYSFSTLTQTATIKPSLNFDLVNIIQDGSLIDNADTLISDRFINSSVTAGSVKAEAPEFVQDLVEHLVLDIDEDGFRTKPVTRSVQAIAKDAGQLSYAWKKYDYYNNEKLEIVFEITMAETKDQKRVEGKLYFTADAVGDRGYVLYKGDVFDKTSEDYVPLYERFSTGTINSIGKYFAIATNRVRQSTATTDSKVCIVKPPVEPVITTNVADKAILNSLNTYTTVLKTVSVINDEGKATYQWFKQAPGKSTFEAIPGATDASYEIVGSATENATTGAEGDGLYKLVITNNLNRNVDGTMAKDDIESGVCRVTHPAAKMVVTATSDIDVTVSEVENGEVLTINAELPKASAERVPGWRLEEDSVTYQWYRYRANGRDLAVDVVAAKAGNYEVAASDIAIAENAQDKKYAPQSSGVFYCLVTNKYNGTIATQTSEFFTVSEA